MKQNVFLVSLFELFNNTLFSRRFSVIEWIQYKKLKTQKQVCFLKKKKRLSLILFIVSQEYYSMCINENKSITVDDLEHFEEIMLFPIFNVLLLSK